MLKKYALITAATMLMMITSCEIFDDPVPSDPRDNFVGNWTVNETSSLYGINNYSATIVKDPNNSTQVLIRNFYHFGMEIDTYAIPTLSSITIPQQNVCNHTVKGTGILNKGKIDWSYTVNDSADIDNVVAVYTKQ